MIDSKGTAYDSIVAIRGDVGTTIKWRTCDYESGEETIPDVLLESHEDDARDVVADALDLVEGEEDIELWP